MLSRIRSPPRLSAWRLDKGSPKPRPSERLSTFTNGLKMISSDSSDIPVPTSSTVKNPSGRYAMRYAVRQSIWLHCKAAHAGSASDKDGWFGDRNHPALRFQSGSAYWESAPACARYIPGPLCLVRQPRFCDFSVPRICHHQNCRKAF